MKFGFTEYEARAYIGLLKSNPATAYEIAKTSGLPTSKIYEVLARLSEKGVVIETMKGNKKHYSPLEPTELIGIYRGRMKKTLESLEEQLSIVGEETEISYIWNISDYTDFIERARRMVSGSQSTLLISTWKEEAEHLADLLEEKEKAKIRMAIVHFGKPNITTGQLFPHPIEDTIYAEKGGRGFVLIADGREAIVGTVEENGNVEGAWSRNSGFVTLAEDYVKHDVYIMKIVNRFDRLLIERFGNNYVKLRDIFNDEEV
ncbi:MAG: TrmB family transcriptional regulator [Spirochaetales bacterium]|nr:TrmB family transcriptional regulator [Spirochaetales bacterium]